MSAVYIHDMINEPYRFGLSVVDCPWCGRNSGSLRVFRLDYRYEYGGGFVILCGGLLGCHARGPVAKTINEAAERWNGRASK